MIFFLFFVTIEQPISENVLLLLISKQGLGKARRIDEAFQILESVEKGIAVGSPRLSAPLICGLLNALIEAGLYI